MPGYLHPHITITFYDNLQIRETLNPFKIGAYSFPKSADMVKVRHVNQIREMVDQGLNDDALVALDELLSLGPSNLEGLKLKALLLSQQGRFVSERKLWERILEIDNEDEDAITFFQKRYIEERERFYFTDELPMGGRRFAANPRALFYTSFIGLVGCTIFLILSGYSRHYALLGTPAVSLGLFGVLVFLPWIAIVFFYLRTLREVVISRDGVMVVTRTKRHILKRDEIANVHMAYDPHPYSARLSLVFIPKDAAKPCIELNVGDHTSSIRAPTFFVLEASRLFGEPLYTSRPALNLKPDSTISF